MNVNITKKQGISIIFILVVICVVLILLGFFLLRQKNTKVPSYNTTPSSYEEITWEIYENKKYDFSIEYPSHWKVSEDYTEGPVINFYPVSERTELPIKDFTGRVAHVSIYPLGVAQGGVNNLSAEADVKIDNLSANSTAFVLSSGETWARYLLFEDLPSSWRPWGFIWAQLPIDDISRYCLTAEGKTPIERCDPYINEIFTDGKVDNTENKVEVRMIESFKLGS